MNRRVSSAGFPACCLAGFLTCRPSPNRKTSSTWPILLLGGRRAYLFFLLRAGLLFLFLNSLSAQTLINVDFGAGSQSRKVGMAAFGQTTNDFWNLYRHYDPRYIPGSPLVYDGELTRLKMSDGTETSISLSVSNAPGVWGNVTGDPMVDTYLFARGGSNMMVRIEGLPEGRYHFYLYGHADADVTGEQNSIFELLSGTNRFGPIFPAPSAAWKAGDSWREGSQFLVFRDVPVAGGQPVTITVGAGPGGVAVLNGLQISTRGTSPPAWSRTPAVLPEPAWTNLLVHAVAYQGTVHARNAQFKVTLDIESKTTNETATVLFQGDLAIQANQLPPGVRLTASNAQFILHTQGVGRHRLQLDLFSKVGREAPWNQTVFTGPSAAMAAIQVEAGDPRLELELLQGISEPGLGNPSVATNAISAGNASLKGWLDSDGVVSLRWRNRQETITRQAWIGVDTATSVHVTPAVIRYRTQLDYSILQGAISNLHLTVPAPQTVTRLEGEKIRDWSIVEQEGVQTLRLDLVQNQSHDYRLVVHSEQPLEAADAPVPLRVVEPRGQSRETGLISISTEDMQAEIQPVSGLRRVNAPTGTFAAYRFSGRPFALTASLRPVEPVLLAAHHLRARLEESRWILHDHLNLAVEKAGIYGLEGRLPEGFTVTEVSGDGVSDWSSTNATLRIIFGNRLIGSRAVDIHLEQPFQILPERIGIGPLRVDRFQKETARLAVSSVPGLRTKTLELSGLREVPINSLPDRSDAALAYESTQADWQLTLATERLNPRVMAEVFNLVTIGEGLVGGSATIRLGIVNQGIQEFRLRLPENWKNLEFIGPNIRRKERQGQDWVIGLQDKAWGGYTLVITYDFPFDVAGALFPLGGAHVLGVERETGTLAVASAGGLQLESQSVSASLRRIDESEIGATDRSMITRPVLLAWRYEGADFSVQMQTRRFDPLPLLEAVADRTQITTVINPEGQTLTQASFKVKNNERQFQRFRLPAGAEFWSCFVNGQPVKAEKDGEWILAPLPRQANRDQAFAVELVYAQKLPKLASWRSSGLHLISPGTDIPNTYAEWEVFIPTTYRLARLGGNMTVVQGTVYDGREAWNRFVAFYARQWNQHGAWIAALSLLTIFVFALVWAWKRQGVRGAWGVGVFFAIFIVLAGMFLPAMINSKLKAPRIAATSINEDFAPPAARIMNEPVAIPQSGMVSLSSVPPERAFGRGGGFGNRLDESSEASQKPSPVVPLRPEAMQPQLLKRYGASSTIPGQAGAPALESRGRLGEVIGDRPIAEALASPPASPVQQAEAEAMRRSAVITEGVRPIHIEIPQSGQVVTFTKTLNTEGQPLMVQARVIKRSVDVMIRSILQASVFLAGLWLILRSRSFSSKGAAWTALGGLMVLASIGHWLLSWKWLHIGLILFIPLLGLTMAVALILRLWQSRVRPVVPLLLILFLGLLSPSGSLEVQGGESPADKVSTNAVSLISASFRGTVTGQVAQLTAAISLNSAQPNQFVSLFQSGVAVSNFRALNGNALLMRQGRWIGVHLPEAGSAQIEMELAARIQGDASRRQLALAIPPALATRFHLRLPGVETEIEFPAAVVLNKTTLDGETVVEATVGPISRVDLAWTPRTKQASETAATIFCHHASLLRFGPSALQVRSLLDYQITQGELQTLRVRLPNMHRLLRIHGEGIQTWTQTDHNGQPQITVELIKAVTGTYRLVLETERDLTLPAAVTVQLPSVLDVRRESGILALQSDEEIGLTVQTNSAARTEASEFEQAASLKLEGTADVFRFLRPDFTLTVLASALQSELEALVQQTYRVGFEQIRLTAQIDCQIKRAGLFLLRMRLPSGYRVESVAGDQVLAWSEPAETNRVLEVTLKERILGSCSLRVDLAQSLLDLPEAISLEGILLMDAHKSSGSIIAASETGIVLKTASFEGLVEIPAATLVSKVGSVQNVSPQPIPAQNTLAFKTTRIPAESPAGWKLNLVTERMEAWVRSEIVHSYQIEETLLTGRAVIRYEIANAPVKRFRVRVPAQMAHVEFGGDNIRRRDRQGQDWQIELQNKVSGIYYLSLQWDEPLASLTNRLDLAGIQTLDVERETGFLALSTRPSFQILEQGVTNLVKIDPVELPDWSGLSKIPATASGQGLPLVRAYRYLKPGYALGIQVKRYEEAGVLQALVDQAHLTTVQAEDGQWMTQALLEIRNNGRQHLELRLPAQAELWSAFVAGQPVQPVRRASSLLLPLERSGSDGAPIRVELTIAGRRAFPLRRGAIEWASPLLDLPIKNARWDLYLPLDYRYQDFAGSMQRQEIVYQTERSVRAYTDHDYSKQEIKAKADQQSEVSGDLLNIRKNLAAGNVKEAVERYSQARQKDVYFNTANQDLKQVERELRRVQGSNLIHAQNAFNFQSLNGSVASAQGSPEMARGELPALQGASSYDEAVAEQQWTKLHQAQEMVSARRQPLRVNLPARGLHFAFAQVLQTDPDKPMTIAMKAISLRRAGWGYTILMWGGIFLFLWICAAWWRPARHVRY